MKVYQINYDLRKRRNYQPLYDKIESYSGWAHPLESCWLVTTNKSATQIRDELTAVMDADDGLLVTRLQSEAAWRNLNSDSANRVTNWLKQHLGQAA